ncbi:hypothetical protein ACH347_33460 [Saccharopolyspora sp. 5N102]|uniref:hypothetical protein n=1 Tax=Saccharopolyspora sp. 5N102 TaxID=3375155 RepID=UPI0037955874
MSVVDKLGAVFQANPHLWVRVGCGYTVGAALHFAAEHMLVQARASSTSEPC